MKRILITGGSGFIGSNLARRLVQDGHDVHLLLRPNENRWRLEAIAGQVVSHGVALQQREALEAIVSDIDPQWVFHLAAYGSYSSQRDVQSIVSTNYDGTVNLVEACLKTEFDAFVNAGSSSEYGYMDHTPGETELPEPNSHYAATKAGATSYCSFSARHHQRRLMTLRLYSVYGPWEDPTRLIPTLLLYGLRGEFPPLVSPSIARDFVYVDDVVNAFVLAASSSTEDLGAVLNVGTGVQTSLKELVDIVRTQLGIGAEPQWGSMRNRDWDSDIWVSDPTRIRSTLGWKASRGLESGLQDFTTWLTAEPGILAHYETFRVPPA